MDYIVRATAANSQIRAFAITSREMVETARQHHNTSPVATAALGRLLTGGAMMGYFASVLCPVALFPTCTRSCSSESPSFSAPPFCILHPSL